MTSYDDDLKAMNQKPPMTTSERAKEIVELTHCLECSDPAFCYSLNNTAHEITALLDLLVEARTRLKHELDCPTIFDRSICQCFMNPLIERINKALEGER